MTAEYNSVTCSLLVLSSLQSCFEARKYMVSALAVGKLQFRLCGDCLCCEWLVAIVYSRYITVYCMCGVAALAVWKLSQCPCESCNFDMVRSRFQYSFVNTNCASMLYSTLLAHGVCALGALVWHEMALLRSLKHIILTSYFAHKMSG